MTCVVLRLSAASLTMALLAPLQLQAQDSYAPREIAVLPAYCQSRMGNNTPEETKRWTDAMGPTYDHIHHYCRGMIAVNRSIGARTIQDRGFQLGVSISEFDYVINSATKGFVLMPEILTKKGESLIRMGQGPKAVVEFERAIELKPDYWPPYVAMSDFYKGTGDIKRAREVLERAVAAAPDARTPRQRLADLSEAKAKPKPAPQPSAEPAPAPSKPPAGK